MMLDRRSLSFAALRAFEATAKHLHMGRAAEELHLTQAAVSHQVRQLEERLGIRLFSRNRHGVALTSAGSRLLVAVTEGIDHIINGARHLDPESLSGSLVVACTQTIASSWATKHLISFARRYPTLTLTLREIAPRQREIPRDIDVAICYGEPDAVDRRLVKLVEPELYPVCSPTLLNEAAGKLRPSDIGQFTLIHDGQVSWDKWFREHDTALDRCGSHINVPNTSLALRAAVLGAGVALCNSLEFQEFLIEGQLVKLFDKPVAEEQAYWLLTASEHRATVKDRAFEEWILRACSQASGF